MRYYPDLPVILRNAVGRCLLEFTDFLRKEGLRTKKDAELVASHPELTDELVPRFAAYRMLYKAFHRDDVAEDNEPEDGGERHHI